MPEHNGNTETRLTGTIKTMNRDKPFGFIKAGNGKEYFFHETDLVNCTWQAIDLGSQMSFRVEETPKGLRAREVDLIDGRAR
jgi:cold shock CspA family protein